MSSRSARHDTFAIERTYDVLLRPLSAVAAAK